MNSMSTNFTDDSKLGSISNSKVREVSQKYLKRFRTITGNSEIQPKKMQANACKSK